MEWAALIRVSLALLLAGAALAKILRFDPFVEALRGYSVVPVRAVRPLGVAVVAAECVVAALLFAGWRPDLALRAAALLMTLFAVAVAVNVVRKGSSDCGCLGSIVRLRLGWGSVVLNTLLAGIAFAASFRDELAAPWPADGVVASAGTLFVIWTLAPLLVVVYWLTLYSLTVARLIETPLTTEDPS